MFALRRGVAGQSRLLSPSPLTAVQGSVRTLAKGRSGKKKAVDLGWDKYIKPLEPEGVQFALPLLRSLNVTHSNQGAGQTGARLLKHVIPQLRWHNPGVQITQEWVIQGPVHVKSPHGARVSDEPTPRAHVELTDGSVQVLDLSGLRVEEALGLVMQTAGADEAAVGSARAWVVDFFRGRPPSTKPHERRRMLKQEEGPAGSLEQALADSLAGDSTTEGQQDAAQPSQSL